MEQKENGSNTIHMPVVGIGASAGGLKAFENFLTNLPPNSGMSFVLIQHLDPHHESELAHLLQNYTDMEVEQVVDKTDLEPNHVYVIPPGKTLSLRQGRLLLSDPEQPHGKRAPIDLFFRSLAEDQKENAICIILSGTGSDGSLGLKNVKELGGVVFVQNPDDAEYKGMPESAIRTGLVDVIADAADLGSKLVGYRESADRIEVLAPDTESKESEQPHLTRIFTLLQTQTSHDFSHYKRATILRRLQRRMQINQISELTAYLEFLRKDHQEINALFKDFLISVTNFFRDKEAFDILESTIIPKIIRHKERGEQIRVWVPGCATGEEAYSIAILFVEAMQRLGKRLDVQIFATDLDEEALNTARRGLYSETISADVSLRRLQRFFVQESNGYRVSREIQEMVLFAAHNLIKDAPFARLDMISCRNLLIYFKREVQLRIFEIFHYALRPEGYLFLGSSETAESITDLFATINKRHRIFQRRPGQVSLPVLPLASPVNWPNVNKAPRAISSKPQTRELGTIHRDLMLKRYAPPSVIVDTNYQIRYKFGDIGRYLTHREGEPSHDILENVNRQLRTELRTALYNVFRYQEGTVSRHLELLGVEETQRLRLIVEPIKMDDQLQEELTDEVMALVIFEDVLDENGKDNVQQVTVGSESQVIEELEDQLKEVRHRLQTTVEEYETSNEELKASNEELQSMNEELRSTTEELETGREELRSTNEELSSVNQELQSKIAEIDQAYNDLENLMAATRIPTIFLDRDLCLKRYTPEALTLFNIIPSDIGRPFDHLSHKLHFENMMTMAATVLKTLETLELKVFSKVNRWYLLRIRPYRTLQDKIDGVILTFVEITKQVEAEQIEHNRAQRQAIVAELGEMALKWTDLQPLMETAVERIKRVLAVDFTKVLELLPDKKGLLLKAGVGWQEGLVGNAIVETGINSQAGYTLRADEPIIVNDLTTESRFSGPDLLLNHDVVSGLSVVIRTGDSPYGVVGVHTKKQRVFSEEDADFLQSVANVLGTAVTHFNDQKERAELMEKIQQERRLLEAVIQRMPAGVIIAEGRTGRLISANPQTEEIWRRPMKLVDDVDDYSDYYEGYYADGHRLESNEWPLARSITSGEIVQNEEIRIRRDDGTEAFISNSSAPIQDQDGRIIAGVVVFEDITEQKAIQETLKQYRDILALSYDAILIWQLGGGIQFWNQGAENLYGYTAEEAMDQESHKLLQTQHPKSWTDIKKKLLETCNWEGELHHKTKDGREVIVSSRHQLLEDIGDGDLVLEINRDVTDYKDAEMEREKLLRELQNLNATLEERVVKRTKQIQRLASFLTVAEQRERERLSYILHDDLQQLLHAIQMRILIIKSHPLVMSDEEVQGYIAELEKLSTRSLQITRSLSVELTPPLLMEDGLKEAFGWLVGHMETVHELEVELLMEDDLIDLSNNMRELIFHMVRELLFNIVKHADVEKAQLKIWQDEGFGFVQVSDRGRGFDSSINDEQSAVGFGLRSIRERLHLFGGALEIHSVPNEGTDIILKLPINNDIQ